jgi:sugar phosphate isomerase/epimerase
MKFAISNIALPAYDHANILFYLQEMGLEGIEIAPSRRWYDWWHGLDYGAVEAYRREIEAAGLKTVGLHSLFWNMPDLGLFKNAEYRAKTLDYMEHLSRICRDLGGYTLVYGGGRKRGRVSSDDAKQETIEFLGELCTRIESHETCYCFEPLGPNDTDFINSALEALEINRVLNHPAFKVQLDAKALVANNEFNIELFESVADQLVHVHANEPDLGVLGSSGDVDHQAMGEMLRHVNYNGYVSIEQRMLNEIDPLPDIAKSAALLTECYI